ncbi:MAG: type II secretion system F family protein [Candidatus Poseidoniales archaeon]|jgi:type II secretory pathway component PulF|tara:strand:+ start:2366 stop:2941 length:576 start_codon:yes stop_codon:yes gene_type:complete
MRALDESREILYVIRTLDVLMSSGVGLEAAIHSMAQGGYGIISKDFADLMKNINKGQPMEKELRALLKKAENDGYKRVINTMLNNITQNTDIIETLRKQGERMEEVRTENVKNYIEELGGVPETLLSIGMIGPIILSLVGIIPQLISGGLAELVGGLEQDTAMSIVNIGLFITVAGMALTGIKAHTKDPGL